MWVGTDVAVFRPPEMPPKVKEAFEELSLSGPEADSLQKTLTEVVSSSQH